MADLQQFNQPRVVDGNGDPVAGAKAYFYETGTMSPVDVFADEALTVLHPSPLVADGAGVFPQVWSNDIVKVVVTTATGATLPGYPLDPAFRSYGGLAGASSVSFAPVDGWAADNVQRAIELAYTRLERYDTITEPLTVSGEDLNRLYGNAKEVTNWNDVTGSGFFVGQDAANAPTSGPTYTGWSSQVGPQVTVAIVIRAGQDEAWIRRKVSGVWQAWALLATQANLDALAAKLIGVGQSWVEPSRSASTSYQNTTGRTITVVITAETQATNIQTSPNGSAWTTIGNGGGDAGEGNAVTFPVGPDTYYRTTGAFERWVELR